MGSRALGSCILFWLFAPDRAPDDADLAAQEQAAQEEAVAHYQQLAGQSSEQVADTLEKIVPAAYHGQVETLFVAAGMQQWGAFNPSKNEIELHDQMESGDESLLDLAAVQSYLKGGIVYSMEPEKVPGGTYAAAVLRY